MPSRATCPQATWPAERGRPARAQGALAQRRRVGRPSWSARSLVALVVKTFLIQAFFIPSLSMYSTLDKGDRVLVNKLSYQLHDIHRGDIVVFERPPGVRRHGIKDLIKRVVGRRGRHRRGPGRHGLRQRQARSERLPRRGHRHGRTSPARPSPTASIFVMGDNRSNSEDSRVFGPIDEDLVVGRAFVRIWPLPDIDCCTGGVAG